VSVNNNNSGVGELTDKYLSKTLIYVSQYTSNCIKWMTYS